MPEKKRLTEKECYELFREYDTPPRAVAHCIEVSRVAYGVAQKLNENGYDFDLELVRISGLIHDVARRFEDHEKKGAEILEGLGYHDEAVIVGAHMKHVFNDIDHLTETDMVCLGDRVVKEHRYVGLDERVDYLIHKREDDEDRKNHLIEWRERIRPFLALIEERMGTTMDKLFRPDLEEILKQVEKPARYIGGEINEVVKDPEDVDVRMAFAFPDLYEIGMSYTGLQILYYALNSRKNIACERVFAPGLDMEELLRRFGYDLFTLETKTSVKEMDVLGFTLQYEMSFTNVLNMIELSGLKLKASERSEQDPLVIAGGPCAFNPEPLADFLDAVLIGDGEELLPEFLERYGEAKKAGKTKREFLESVCSMDGVYVPSFYEPEYTDDGRVKAYRKTFEGAPDRVKKALIPDIEGASFPDRVIVPFIETVHDRAVVETFRGCTRGCRFCQAGMIYRPVRERSVDTIVGASENQLRNTGYDEVSLLSLSTSDYSDFEGMAGRLLDDCREKNVSLSLPSLRLDSFSFKVLDEIQKYKRSGLTFAPEAGTQRMRDVINKGITEEDIYGAVKEAIELGWRHVKLYFMIGLPGETDEDLDGIAGIASGIRDIFRKSGKKGRFDVTVSVSNFVPKPFTPFQWAPQNSAEEFSRKHDHLAEKLRHIKGVRFTHHDSLVSECEAVLARGDRRCSELLLAAHEAGLKFDSWSDLFDEDKWREVLAAWDIDYRFYSERSRGYDEVMPWDVVDAGVTKRYLVNECEKAKQALTTHDCRRGCTGCGIMKRMRCPLGGIYGGAAPGAEEGPDE